MLTRAAGCTACTRGKLQPASQREMGQATLARMASLSNMLPVASYRSLVERPMPLRYSPIPNARALSTAVGTRYPRARLLACIQVAVASAVVSSAE
eukprot:967134-Heterocapsa_arctica.AAC.1